MPLLELLSSVSDEDLLALSRRNPGLKLERTAEGRLRVSPTGGESGRVSAEVLGQLYRWNEEKGLGVAFGTLRLPTGLPRPRGALAFSRAHLAPGGL
jgi:Uma2 family endonuclease